MSVNNLEKVIEQTVQDIKSMDTIQGNTNVAKTVAKTILYYITHTKPHNLGKFVAEIKMHGEELANARLNEPLAVNAVAFIIKDLDKCETQQQIRIKALERVEKFFKYIDESYEVIRLNACNLLKGHKTYFVHSGSALVRDILVKIHQEDPEILVITSEMNPGNQGRIVSQKLYEAGVNVLHISDAALGAIFLDPRYPKPDIAIVGSEGFTINGDLVGRVGTFNTALAAKASGVPLYIATQFMKVDMRLNDGLLAVEQRDKDEVWAGRPEGIDILNPAFDFVPEEYITGGYITEKGLIETGEIKKFLA